MPRDFLSVDRDTRELPADTKALYSNLPKGVPIFVYKNGTTWPARPTANPDTPVVWVGADPSPAVITSGTSGMYNTDHRDKP